MRDENFLGYQLNNSSLDSIVKRSMASIEAGGDQLVMACANPHSLVEASRDDLFSAALNDAELLLTDGVGVKVAGELLRLSVGPRISGNEFFRALHAEMDNAQANRRLRVAFFGSSEAVLEKIAVKMKEHYSQLEVCSLLSPPFGEWSDDKNELMISQINRSKPDVLWVGMTAPKQEKWVSLNRSKLDVSVIGSVGAVFDFFAETYPRAPDLLCRMGLEWVYRLAKEPARMWKRTFVSAPKFLAMVFTTHIVGSPRRKL